MKTKLYALIGALSLFATACSKPGIDGGEKGGQAFITLAVFLVIGCIILYIALGRED